MEVVFSQRNGDRRNCGYTFFDSITLNFPVPQRRQEEQFLQPAQIHHRRSLPATMLPNVCSIFAVCIWTLTFSTSCASVVLLPSTFSPRKSLLSCNSRHNMGAVVAKFFGSSRLHSSRWTEFPLARRRLAPRPAR